MAERLYLPDLPALPVGQWPAEVLSAYGIIQQSFIHGRQLLARDENNPLRLRIAADSIVDKSRILDELTVAVGDNEWRTKLVEAILPLENALRVGSTSISLR